MTVTTKFRECLRNSGHLSYTREQKLILDKIAALEYAREPICCGSGPTCMEAIKNRLFKRHDRWRSEITKDGYVKDSTDK